MSNNVKLIAVTKTVGLPGIETAEQLIGFVARVSNPKNQSNLDTMPKLLHYLTENKHWSPLQLVHLVIEIKTTRDIGRQILRHRSFTFQEFSQRYAEVDVNEFEFREARLQDKKNRQNSVETDDQILKDTWTVKQSLVMAAADNAYRWALENGVAKEQARCVLPEGMTVTTMYMAGSLRDWYFYCQLRMGNGTQKEHQEIAKQCWKILCEEFPFLLDN